MHFIGEQEIQVYNPVETGFVTKAGEWKYSSAPDHCKGKGLLIKMSDTLTL